MEFRFLGNSGLKVSAISTATGSHMAHKSRSM
jgi:aryl-alcohol dehydrogenase-like predicted oxidoreductase